MLVVLLCPVQRVDDDALAVLTGVLFARGGQLVLAGEDVVEVESELVCLCLLLLSLLLTIGVFGVNVV